MLKLTSNRESVRAKAEKISRDIVNQSFSDKSVKQVRETGRMQWKKMKSLPKSIKIIQSIKI